MFVQWSKDIEIGIKFVDADHKVLINLLNQINDCVLQREESTVVGSVLEALVAYTDYHFNREEQMLVACGYQDIGRHQETHNELSNQVHKIYTDHQKDPWKVDPEDVLDFLKSWLINHIMGHDFAYRGACVDHESASDLASDVLFFPASPQVPFSDWGNLRIMLVDDNPNFRKLIQTLLKAVGVRHLQIAKSANEGLARLSQRPADVVLCDMVMDGMSGIEFARQLQNMDLATRIIMMTGYSSDEMEKRSSGLGVSGFLEKPIKAHVLLETIAKAAICIPAAPALSA